jgi:AhpD family alkylhydroperoxidase
VARLDYVEPRSSAAADEMYARVSRLGRPLLNLYRELANQPAALGAFLEMSRYIRSDSSLDAGLRELSILATAHALGQEYEIRHHTDAAVRAGVAAEKVAATAPDHALDPLTERERCAVEFAREAAFARTCSDAMFRRMQSLFTDAEIVDLVVTAGWYHLCAVILGSLRIDLEDA